MKPVILPMTVDPDLSVDEVFNIERYDPTAVPTDVFLNTICGATRRPGYYRSTYHDFGKTNRK